MSYKKCFILSCVNNSKRNPEKRFLYVPTNVAKRNQWCQAVARPLGSLKRRTPAYCCIDHFNIDDDFEDPVDEFALPKLKAGVIPCLKNLDSSVEQIVSFSSHMSNFSNSTKESSSFSIVTNTDSEFIPTSSGTSSDYDDYDEYNSESESLTSANNENVNRKREHRELAEMKQKILLKTELVKNYFGIELEKMYLLDIIVEEANITKEILSVMAEALKNFVVWSDAEVVEHRLPVAFRANFKDVVSIIDCFEIQIQKPSNPVHQSHTWSQYKECNTVKYLVSSTPDGIINFISEGFGGRISDLEIVKSSGFLDVLPRNSVVMADRGFKSIESLLETKSCHLVRPPSVATGQSVTKDEVRLTKQVAALRIHIERVIKRFREFGMLLPHATVPIHLFTPKFR